PDDAVLAQAQKLATEMLQTGTTTFECKSGYGLSRDGELRSLKLAAALDAHVPQTTTHTALLAHAVPAGYTTATWLHDVDAMLPDAAEYADTLDIFVESIAFNVE